jgi:ribosomal protein S18 acetylase RimI-like enzyme
MIPGLTIRPAKAADREAVCQLIYLTMGSEADWLFNYWKESNTLEVIGSLFLQPGNRASYCVSHVAEKDGRVAGLLVAYPGRILSSLDLHTAWHIFRTYGLIAAFQLVFRQPAYGSIKETEKDEFYISNLGVFPAYQGMGIGTGLMGFAESLAREDRLYKCSLLVSFGHANARRLYENLGYAVTQTYPCKHPEIAEGSGGYLRMVKNLEIPAPAG